MSSLVDDNNSNHGGKKTAQSGPAQPGTISPELLFENTSEAQLGGCRSTSTHSQQHLPNQNGVGAGPAPGSSESSESYRTGGKERSDKRKGVTQTPNDPTKAKSRDGGPQRKSKKRQRMQDMETSLTQLSSQVQELQALQNKNTMLLEHSTKLEEAVKEKDNELQRLRSQVAQAQLLNGDVQGNGAQQNTAPVSEQELKQAYCNSVQSLKDYMALSNLLSYDITGKNLPDKVTADLKILIHQISKVCLLVIKPESPYVMELISKDFTQATTTDWDMDRTHWCNVISQLQLTDQQVLTILKSREQHMFKMMALYQERAVLARQIAEVALQCTVNPGANVGNIASDNLNVLMKHGYLYCVRNMVMIHKLVELIKDNLHREQKTVMELFLKVVYQILSPVQAALFVVESFPYHCDVLALSNVLAMACTGKTGMMPREQGMQSAPDATSLGGDADVLASFMQMQGGSTSMDGRGFGTDSGSLPVPGASGTAVGGPTTEGLVRLRNFLDQASLGDSFEAGLHALAANDMPGSSNLASGRGVNLPGGLGMGLQQGMGLGGLAGSSGLAGAGSRSGLNPGNGSSTGPPGVNTSGPPPTSLLNLEGLERLERIESLACAADSLMPGANLSQPGSGGGAGPTGAGGQGGLGGMRTGMTAGGPAGPAGLQNMAGTPPGMVPTSATGQMAGGVGGMQAVRVASAQLDGGLPGMGGQVVPGAGGNMAAAQHMMLAMGAQNGLASANDPSGAMTLGPNGAMNGFGGMMPGAGHMQLGGQDLTKGAAGMQLMQGSAGIGAKHPLNMMSMGGQGGMMGPQGLLGAQQAGFAAAQGGGMYGLQLRGHLIGGGGGQADMLASMQASNGQMLMGGGAVPNAMGQDLTGMSLGAPGQANGLGKLGGNAGMMLQMGGLNNARQLGGLDLSSGAGLGVPQQGQQASLGARQRIQEMK